MTRSGRPRRLVTRSLVRPDEVPAGGAFLVPALAADGAPAQWWHLARAVRLAWDDGTGPRVRLILAETDRRGRAYRLDMHTADTVVWAPSLPPVALAVPRLGHRVGCTTRGCPRAWGHLPVTVSSAPCYPCAQTHVTGI